MRREPAVGVAGIAAPGGVRSTTSARATEALSLPNPSSATTSQAWRPSARAAPGIAEVVPAPTVATVAPSTRSR